MLALVLFGHGCGSAVESSGGPGSTGGGGGAATGGHDAGADAAADAGFTSCSTPSGFRICGGPARCSAKDLGCDCLDQKLAAQGEPIACASGNDAWVKFGAHDVMCPDGTLMAEWAGLDNGFFCAPYEIGVLFDHLGFSKAVRYADYGLWTGAALPEPTSCPTPSGYTICGGNCGGCPAGEVCTGRSPRHPYGICVTENNEGCRLATTPSPPGGQPCSDGSGCFTFTVEPEAQPLADESGYCFPKAVCTSLAATLPGGAKCTLP
jgi:hypothetical protein